ncbi:MAG: hypothetical protein ACOYNY_21340 [Caldilineaceae bacterium]
MPPPEFESDEERSYFLVRLPVHPAAQVRVDEAESGPSRGRVSSDQIIAILQQGEASASEIAPFPEVWSART